MSDNYTYADGHADGWSEGYAEGVSETEEIRAALFRLEKTHAGDHRGFIESRRSLVDRIRQLETENAELRGDVERLRSLPVWTGQWVQESIADRWKAERDDLRAQLAAAQAQLAEARKLAEVHRLSHHAQIQITKTAEARLEAVRALCDRMNEGYLDVSDFAVEQIRAALSAAPQPEPEAVMADWYDDEPDASDEPARCKGFSWIGQSFARCDACGKPYWGHTHNRQYRPGAALFAADSEMLVPITPDEAAQVKAKWGK